MKILRQASEVSLPSALTALEDLVCTRLFPELRTEQVGDETTQKWLEKATIAYILFARSPTQNSQTDALTGVQRLLDHIKDEGSLAFTAKATHAAQTLMWQAAIEPYTQEWLQLLKNPIFDNAGHLNKARIGR
jgi:hypothetical protein